MSSFKDVVGHKNIIKYISSAVQADAVSHAYILNGERGSGKRLLANLFAMSLQCQNRAEDGEACGKCQSCKQAQSGNQPDIIKVTHEKPNTISVDDIRTQVNNDIVIKPYSSKYKIYIIPEADLMSAQAQNALLKTIEEPPEYAIIILLTNNADTFLQTILSRCVLLNIRPVREEIIKNQLMSEYDISSYEAGVAAAFSEGNPGKAVKFAASEDFKELKDQLVGMILSLEHAGMDIISENIKKASQYKKHLDEYFDLLRIWFRDVLMYKATGISEKIIFQDEYKMIEEMSDKISYYNLDNIQKAIDNAQDRIRVNANFDITMEVLFLDIKGRIGK